MAGIIENNVVRINVVSSECEIENRLLIKPPLAKSKTGSFFIKTVENADEYKSFFAKGLKYSFDKEKIRAYQKDLNNNNEVRKYSVFYKDCYNNGIRACTNLLNASDNDLSDIEVEYSWGDTKKSGRVDKRFSVSFSKGRDPIVKSFCRILYDGLTQLVFEKKQDKMALHQHVWVASPPFFVDFRLN